MEYPPKGFFGSTLMAKYCSENVYTVRPNKQKNWQSRISADIISKILKLQHN